MYFWVKNYAFLTQKVVVWVPLVFECKATITDMVKVLEPFKVRYSHTTGIDIEIWNNQDVVFQEDLVSTGSCWAVGTLGNNLKRKREENI